VGQGRVVARKVPAPRCGGAAHFVIGRHIVVVTKKIMMDAADRLLTPAEVAAIFAVNTSTVTCWANTGKIHAIRTLGGHRRFKASDIRRATTDVVGERA
jgi:excisionase family DNA binding protein